MSFSLYEAPNAAFFCGNCRNVECTGSTLPDCELALHRHNLPADVRRHTPTMVHSTYTPLDLFPSGNEPSTDGFLDAFLALNPCSEELFREEHQAPQINVGAQGLAGAQGLVDPLLDGSMSQLPQSVEINAPQLQGGNLVEGSLPDPSNSFVAPAAAAAPATPPAGPASPEAPAPKKRGRPKGSLDKVQRNKKGEGLAKKPVYRKIGRPTNERREAARKLGALREEMKRLEKAGGVVSAEQHEEEERLVAEVEAEASSDVAKKK